MEHFDEFQVIGDGDPAAGNSLLPKPFYSMSMSKWDDLCSKCNVYVLEVTGLFQEGKGSAWKSSLKRLSVKYATAPTTRIEFLSRRPSPAPSPSPPPHPSPQSPSPLKDKKDTATSVLNDYVHVIEAGSSESKRVDFYAPVKLAKKLKAAKLKEAKKGKKRG